MSFSDITARWPTRPAVGACLRALATTLALSACLGCGGGQTRGHPLDSAWDDKDGSELGAFVSGWQLPEAPRVANVVVGVVDDQTLVAHSLDENQRWHYQHRLDGLPRVAGNVVVATGEDTLLALASDDGELLWERKVLGRLRGAGDDGETTLVSVASLSEKRSIVLAIDRSGSVVRQIDEEALVGDPVIFDEFAFLPWNRRLVVIFDLVDGREKARVVSSSAVSHAFLLGDELFFGEESAVRFDGDIVAARAGGGSRVEVPQRPWILPVPPVWLGRGDVTLPSHATAQDMSRYYARPQQRGKDWRVEQTVFSYHRAVLGLDATGRTRWTRLLEAPVIGGYAGVASVALCDASGHVTWFDAANGAVRHELDLGASLQACLVQSEAPPGGLTDIEPPPPDERLVELLIEAEPALLPLQLELLDELATRPGEGVARVMIMTAVFAAPLVRERAERLLARRRTGREAMIAALERDWLKRPVGGPSGEARPPVAALAAALARAGDERAAAALTHWLDTSRSAPEALLAVATALSQIATPAERWPLKLFLARYVCTPELQGAVAQVAQGLRRLGETATVERVYRQAPCDTDETGGSSLRRRRGSSQLARARGAAPAQPPMTSP